MQKSLQRFHLFQVMGFVKTKYANQSDDWPDIQFFFTSYADNTDGGLFGKKAVGLTDDYYAAVYEEILYKEAFNVITLLMRPQSKGYLKLKDKDPNSKVLIYPNYYTEPIDMKIMVSSNALLLYVTQKIFNYSYLRVSITSSLTSFLNVDICFIALDP